LVPFVGLKQHPPHLHQVVTRNDERYRKKRASLPLTARVPDPSECIFKDRLRGGPAVVKRILVGKGCWHAAPSPINPNKNHSSKKRSMGRGGGHKLGKSCWLGHDKLLAEPCSRGKPSALSKALPPVLHSRGYGDPNLYFPHLPPTRLHFKTRGVRPRPTQVGSGYNPPPRGGPEGPKKRGLKKGFCQKMGQKNSRSSAGPRSPGGSGRTHPPTQPRGSPTIKRSLLAISTQTTAKSHLVKRGYLGGRDAHILPPPLKKNSTLPP